MESPSLISTHELADRMGDEQIRIVDLRWSLEDEERGLCDYRASHIPGAVYLHWLRDLSDPDDPVEGQIAPPDRFSAVMSSVGIGNSTLVVAYDDSEILMASRLYWALAYYGHGAVRVLDGGWQKWCREGRPTSSAIPTITEAEFVATPRDSLRLTKSDVMGSLELGTAILDCRMDETWFESGEHIPGARRFPAPQLLNATGTYIPDDDVLRRAHDLGLSKDDEVILYCGGGVSASAAFRALHSAGYTNVSVYDGSWAEWGDDAEAPREPHDVR
ncbi:MAG: sulfurtransferase [Acidimicrobiia bacterium]